MSRNDFKTSQIDSKDLAPFAFILFAVVGGILIGASKWLAFPTAVVVIVPIVVLVGYTYVSWNLPRLELRRDQIGDNAYYLGFILTLVSLTITLMQYSSNANDDYIVSNFGSALASTVVGIFIRSVISQFRKDVTGVERDMHASLREASMQLRSQMFSSVEAFGSLHRQMAQITEESVDVVAAAHMKFADGLHMIMDERMAILDKQVEASSAAIEARIDKMVAEMEVAGRAFTNGAKAEQKALADTASFVRKSLSEFESITFDTSSLDDIEGALVDFTKSISSKLSASATAASLHAETIATSSESMSGVAQATQEGIKKQLIILEKQMFSMVTAADEVEALHDKFISLEASYGVALKKGSDSVLESAKQFDEKLGLQIKVVEGRIGALQGQESSSLSQNYTGDEIELTTEKSFDEGSVVDGSLGTVPQRE